MPMDPRNGIWRNIKQKKAKFFCYFQPGETVLLKQHDSLTRLRNRKMMAVDEFLNMYERVSDLPCATVQSESPQPKGTHDADKHVDEGTPVEPVG